MPKDNPSATSASSATTATVSARPGDTAKMNTESDSFAASIAERNAASSDAPGIARDGSASAVADGADSSGAQAARDRQEQANRERAAAQAAAPRMIAEAAAALAAGAAQRDMIEAPSIREQAKAGTLPDPVDLALKARGATGSGRRLDETIAGGLTVHPDGYFKNAKGEEVRADGSVVEGGAQPRIDVSGARIGQL